MLTRESSTRLIISIIFNQSQKSQAAFRAPDELRRRLGHESLDLQLIEKEGYESLYNAISTKPCLHRFVKTMANSIYSTAVYINENFDSDPREIWQGRTPLEILGELTKLKGIGRHKAVQCIIYLHHLGEIEEVPEEYYQYMILNCDGFFDDIPRDIELILSRKGKEAINA